MIEANLSLWHACICWAVAFLLLACATVVGALGWDIAELLLRLGAPLVVLGALAFQARAARQAQAARANPLVIDLRPPTPDWFK